MVERAVSLQQLGERAVERSVLLLADLHFARAYRLLAMYGDSPTQVAFASAIEDVAADSAARGSVRPIRDRLIEAIALVPTETEVHARGQTVAPALASVHRNDAEETLGDAVWFARTRATISEAMSLQLRADPACVAAPAQGLVDAGGKRLRSLLVIASSSLGPQANAARAIQLAAAIEFLHTATLIHDDYIDESSRRRGVPTIVATEGPEVAIAIGDYYFAKATRLVAELQDMAVTMLISEAIEAICVSQLEEVDCRGCYSGGPDAYMRIARGKTGALFSASSAAGARLTGAREPYVDSLRRYGELVGLAFQLTDDLIDFNDISGKPQGQDIRQGTFSLPLIFSSEDEQLGGTLRELLTAERDEAAVGRALSLVINAGALERVKRQSVELVNHAISNLESIDAGPTRSRLEAIAHAAVSRHA
jgi:heptaprenyl diphosphate synthase